MKVFLTGGTGFLGSHVAEALVKDGHEVTALVRSESRAAFLKSLGVQTCHGSLDSEDGLSGVEPVLERCDAVVHVAGLVKAIRLQDFHRVNLEGSTRLANAAVRRGVRRFLLVSSIAAQGPGTGAMARPADLPESPVTAYGRSKLAAERAVLEHADRLDITILRPPVIYGPRDLEFLKVFQAASRLGLVPVLDPDQVLSLIHASDCAQAIAKAVRLERTPRAVYPVDDGGAHTWREIARTLGQVLGRRVRVLRLPRWVVWTGAWVWQTSGRLTRTPVVMSTDKVREAEARYWVVGCDAAREDLGYAPLYSLETGFEDTVRWARAGGLL